LVWGKICPANSLNEIPLGNNGAQPRISRPANYTDRNVQNEIPKNLHIDMTDANGDYGCDLEEWIYNLFVFYWLL
jgi:hypothetical protein